MGWLGPALAANQACISGVNREGGFLSLSTVWHGTLNMEEKADTKQEHNALSHMSHDKRSHDSECGDYMNMIRT